MEVLIKYCTNSFPQVDQFIWEKIDQLPVILLDEPIRFRFRTDWPIGKAQEVKRNLNLYELINLGKWIHAIFYQHFHCIDSNCSYWEYIDFSVCFQKSQCLNLEHPACFCELHKHII
jgi:hypothetical protein